MASEAQSVRRQRANIAVGPTIHVSKAFPNVAHHETLAHGDPRHPGRMAVCSELFPTDSARSFLIRQNCYVTFDGGKTWDPTLKIAVGWGDQDPAVWYGKGDTVYAITLTQEYPNVALDPGPDAPPRHKDFTIVYRSTDGGRTWSDVGRFDNIDRQYIVVDDTNGPFSGRIYTVGQHGVPSISGYGPSALYMRWSADAGKTWMGPTFAAYPQGTGIAGVATGGVFSDGTMIGFFGLTKAGRSQSLEMDSRGPNAELHVITTRDGGETFDKSTKIADWTMDRPRTEGALIGQLYVDPGSKAFKDRVYVAYPEVVDDRLQVRVSYSSDKGKTWSRPVTVNDDRTPEEKGKGPDHMLPAIGVNKDGVVMVAWYDRREAKDNLGWRPRAAVSFDGGDTFSASVPITENMNSYTSSTPWHVSGRLSGSSISVGTGVFFTSAGHTNGLAVDADGTFHPTWIDNHTGIAQLYSAGIKVDGVVSKNGAADLAELEDISDAITFETSNVVYDRDRGTITMQARLKNTTKDTIKGPVKVRVLTLESEFGVPEVTNADNGEHGTGAVWDLSSLVPTGGLASLQASQPKTLTFKLTDVRGMGQGKNLRDNLLNIRSKTLGKRVKAAATDKPK
jgi:hypothetical protein